MRRSFAAAANVEQDARHLAQEAADRAGLRMDDWLKTIFEEYAKARGLSSEDLAEDERTKAVYDHLLSQGQPVVAAPKSSDARDIATSQGDNPSLNDLLKSLADRVGTFKETPPQVEPAPSLRAQLSRLSRRMDSPPQPKPVERQADRHVENALQRVEALRDLNLKTDEIRDLVVTMSQRPNVAAKIERHLDIIATRIETLGQQSANAQDVKDIALGLIELRNVVQRSANPALMDALEQRIEELNGRLSAALIKLDPTQRFDDLTRRIETVNRRLEASLGDLNTSHLQDMMQDVIAKLDRPRAGDAMQLANIESELRKLATRVDGAVEAPQEMINILRKDLTGLHRRLDILSENAQDTSAIRHLNMRVSQLSDQIETLQRDPKTFAGLETVITKLNEKIDSFAQAERDQDVVIKLRDEVLRLTQRIDANPPENLSPALKMLEQVQHHLERLSQNAPTREDRARVQGLETAVRDLHKQVADLRESIKDGISKSTASLSASFSDATAASIERELTKLRQQQEHSDRQTAHTLASLHQTMQSVIERISTLENEDDELRASPARNQSPALGDLSRLDIRAEELLSPGQGRPGHSEDAPAPTLPSPSAAAASQASFIAAARRAARAAQEAAERAEKQDVVQRRQLLKVDFFATMLKKQKRNAVVGLTSLAVIIAAVQAMRFIPDDKPVAKVAAPKTVTAPAKTAVASPQQDKAMLSNQPVATLGDMVNASPINTVKASAVDPNPMGNGVTTTLAPRIRVSDAAAKGDAAAQFELGMRYLDGRGMAQDAQQALNWLSKAAQQNLAPAQFRLASMHERGVGTPKDLKRARELYLKAAQQGHARSMHNLGVLYAEGAEGKPDYTTALTWFKKAAELGVRDSQFNLAILYARGMGTEQNIVQGWVWFNAATQQGDVDAGRKRDEIATRMTATQISTAKSQADSLKIRKPDVAANDVLPPAGGWDETPELSVQSKPPATSATVNPRVSKL